MITRAEVAAFEADFKKRYLPLAKKLKKVEDDIYRLMINSMANAKMSTAYWRAQSVKLNALYKEMNILFTDWAKIQIPARYKRSLKLISQRISATKAIIETGKKGLTELLSSSASTQIIFGLYNSGVESFLSSSLSGRRLLKNLFIASQQTLINESFVNIAVGVGFEMGDLRQAKTLLKTMFESPAWKMIDKRHFVQAGKYKYRPHYYAEMIARTKFHQAHSQATLVQAQNYGTDLVEISSHNTTTPICIPFEGNIYSIRGKHPVFPPLMDVPPFHPNCLHLMYPTFESGLIAQGIKVA
ncbi:MAG: phage minor capsid protein [Candidatus Heimdallarchaeaceae archaeon]